MWGNSHKILFFPLYEISRESLNWPNDWKIWGKKWKDWSNWPNILCLTEQHPFFHFLLFSHLIFARLPSSPPPPVRVYSRGGDRQSGEAAPSNQARCLSIICSYRCAMFADCKCAFKKFSMPCQEVLREQFYGGLLWSSSLGALGRVQLFIDLSGANRGPLRPWRGI